MGLNVTPIVTLDHRHTKQDIEWFLDSGIYSFRINPARIGIEQGMAVYDRVTALTPNASFYFDTLGNKQRINKRKNKDAQYAIHINEWNETIYVEESFAKNVQEYDCVVVRAMSDIELCITKKNDKEAFGEIVSINMICHEIKDKSHIYIKNRYIPNTDISKRDCEIIRAFGNKGIMCLSFVDSPRVLNKAKKLCGGNKYYAKIESPVGVANFKNILESADGIIVGRDDLSVFYSYEEINHIALDMARSCNLKSMEIIPASNYFIEVLETGEISDKQKTVLEDLYAIGVHSLYINETVLSRQHSFVRWLAQYCRGV